MSEQLPLPVQLPDEETFDNLIPGENLHVISHLKSLLEENPKRYSFLTFLSGESGVGKSHLLYSLCHLAKSADINHLYLDLKNKDQLSEQLLEGLESIDLVCIDDLDSLIGDVKWQYALFDLINRVKETQKCQLVLTAKPGPNAIGVDLADLKSRLSWGVSFHVQSLNDQNMAEALVKRAKHRGINLPSAVAQYLITHTRRDMSHLMQVLETLDQHSLKHKRKLTVPFVKDALSL